MYFRIREKTDFIEKNAIKVYSSSRGPNDVLDVPALDSAILAPLRDKDTAVIIDTGGDPKGALVLRSYRNYIKDSDNIFVVNANRPETANVDDVIKYLRDIEAFSGRRATHLINTTHMLKETTKEDILKGHSLVKEVSKKTDLEFVFDVCVKNVADEILNDENISKEVKEKIFPIDLHFREDWMM